MKAEKDFFEFGSYAAVGARAGNSCSLCRQRKQLSDIFIINDCYHSFCWSCAGRYVESMATLNAASISCPVPGCKEGIFEPELCKPFVSPEVFDHWSLSLCVAAIEKKAYCPFTDCSVLLSDERGGAQAADMQAVCPHCRRQFRG